MSPRSASVELRDQVQRVALEWPNYGSRRITAELRRGGLAVNRKRVQRMMREDNLLGFWVRSPTEISRHLSVDAHAREAGNRRWRVLRSLSRP